MRDKMFLRANFLQNQPLGVKPVKEVIKMEKREDVKLKAVEVAFQINGIQHQISDADYGPSMSLARYIREVACLTGTKVSCNEGGCGACIVSVQKHKEDVTRSLNSCLTPVLACDGWSITTVEGLGNRRDGYHPIQARLAAEGGSQCGYCSPGMVMQLHSWLQEHPAATQLEIDNILDGNICRCTGYRPILDAFKSFASSESLALGDIEDLKICRTRGTPCPGQGGCGGQTHCKQELKMNGGFEWFAPTTVQQLIDILKGISTDAKYRIVSGNTGTGVFKNDGPYSVYININKIPELHASTVAEEAVLGANVNITDAIHLLEGTNTEVGVGVAHHLLKIASYGVRNQGSLAGNLMMKQQHKDFPSDVFLSLETAGAVLEIWDYSGAVTFIPVGQLPATDMSRKILVRIKLALNSKLQKKDLSTLWLHQSPTKPRAGTGEWKFKSFKIMPRSTNAHAYVNAGFLALVDPSDNFKLLEKPRIVFGGISSTFIHAAATETFLQGRNLNDHDVFLEALAILAEELIPEEDPALSSPLYRKQLALGLFYKFFLYVLGEAASESVRSGAEDLDRGLSSGKQDWETDEDQWPITEPREKYEAKIQCSGEAEYVNDIPPVAGELHAAFVLTTVANCEVASVNTEDALAMDGVHAYVSASDIPGTNDWKLGTTLQPIFLTRRSEYAGQAVGLIVADTREIALEAARKVSISYSDHGEVITDIEVAMQRPDHVSSGNPAMSYGDSGSALATADVVVAGRFRMGSQYHFYMETHVCIAKPTEDGFDLEIPTQDINLTANVVAKALNTSVNSINISVKRLGGAYGGKIELQNSLATAAAVAANKLRRPVRLWLTLEDNMNMLGKRTPYVFDYKIGFDSKRKIVGVESEIYCDAGWNFNGDDSLFAILFGQSCYHIPNLKMTPFGVKTHTQAHTATRAPGMCNGHAMLEQMLEHAAAELGMDALDLRLNNLMVQGSPVLPPPDTLNTPCPIQQMTEQIKTTSDYDQRKSAVSAFNVANKWKKRGLAVVPMRFPHEIKGWGIKYHCLVSVFAEDGTISVTHGGIEMGQGLNTKVQQVVAKELGVDMSMIKIKPVSNITNPNGSTTGGSFGSELNCAAAIKACGILNQNLADTRKKLGPGASWQEVITEANNNNVDLCARYMLSPDTDEKISGYSIWGVSVVEVEVDVLTGEMFIVRADILEDAGLSTSPQVDIGQVEGAFVMGLGLWTSEEIRFNPTTGALITKNTWEYKPPAAKDIPQDLRVTLLKNARNPVGVLSSKATGEPALLMSISVLFAIRDALTHSRAQTGLTGWWKLDGPATVEKIHQHAGISPEQFVF